MINIRNPNDNSDAIALGPTGGMIVESTPTAYNKPGIPAPPAGWGKVVTMVDSVDGDDEGPESKDEY